jgi:putative membrane protein
MHYWNDGHDAWWWMVPMMIVTLVVIGAVVSALVRATDHPASPKAPSPQEVLARRLAAGEIDTAEYDERLDALRARVRPSG